MFAGASSQLKSAFSEGKPPFDALVCVDFRCAQEVSHLIMLHGLDNPTGVLIATSPFFLQKLPVPSVYIKGIADKVAYQGVKILISMVTGNESQSDLKLELTPDVWLDTGTQLT